MTLSCRNNQEVLHHNGRAVLRGFVDRKTRSAYPSARTSSEEPVIPKPTLFEENHVTNSERAARLPTVAECAIHLELLETLFVLRERILRSEDIDNSMGITRKRETKTGHNGDTKTFKDATFESRRQAKWIRFIEFAVVRFLDWRTRFVAQSQHDEEFTLPPLDIIMVWHTFLLNPLLFNKHCRTEKLYKMPLPWGAIHQGINNREWSFTANAKTGDHTPSLFDLFSNWNSHLDALSPTLKLSSLRVERFGSTTETNTATMTSFFSNRLTATQHPKPVTRDDIKDLSVSNPIRIHAEMFLSSDPQLATELKAAVIRQTTFIDKMHSHLWIRSPSLEGTLARSISRYEKFLLLMRRNPGTLMVPTLDIDLAWHTHQCAAWGYVQETKRRVGRFVNHDDSIGKGILDTGSEGTRRLWRVQFGEEYHICGCWDCEMLTSEIEHTLISGDGGGPDVESSEFDMQTVAKRVDSEVRFYRAVEAARRRGSALPMRQ
ncbi:hypothetical protein QBC40DRAFT_224494 [Triangularia verruculosa]|uniref:Uncharacterized protein n=1 Tax=Triangularia verruculosa TaxID=2587418 RepID=A0AAN6XIF6_9PEZI|nr:hypothetical protein QBC40DRAFT_224494 [Triangularia verruculosa]